MEYAGNGEGLVVHSNIEVLQLELESIGISHNVSK